jgi:hypothetical protein
LASLIDHQVTGQGLARGAFLAKSLFNKLQPIEVGAGKRRAWKSISARELDGRAQAIVGHSSWIQVIQVSFKLD